jgi:hypothetical protein
VADNTQVIRVVYEATEAERAARARSSAEQKRLRDEANAAKKAAKEASDAQKAAAKEAADAAKKASKEAADTAKDAAKEGTEARKRAAQEAARAERAEIRKTAEISKLEDRLILRDYQMRVRAQAREAKKASEESVKAWQAQQDSIVGATKSVGLFAAGMLGLNSVSSILHMIVEQFNAVRVAGLKASADILDEALELRQLGALQGEMGQPSQQLLQQLAFRTKTLQTVGDAREMTVEAMASGFGAIKAGLVSDNEFQKHLVTAGQLQKMTGAEAGAVGKMSGILPMVTGKPVNTAADLDVLMERLYKEQQLSGFKDYGQAATQFAGSAEYVMKGVYNAPTAQALLSAFAMAGQAGTASERLSQVTTAVSAGVLRNRGMKVNPEYESLIERSGDYFKGLGVTPNTKTEDRIMAVVKDLLAKEDEAKANGLNWNPMDYLLEKGFINVQSRESLAKLADVERTGGQLSNILELGNAPLADTSGIQAQFERSKSVDPTMAREEARATDRLAQFRAGLGGQGEGLFRDEMIEKAYASLGGEAAFGKGNTLETVMGRSVINPYELVFRQRQQVELEAQRQIIAAARQQGVRTPEVGTRGDAIFLGWEKLFEIGQQTRAAGGTLAPETNPGKTNDLLTEIRDLMKLTVPEKGGAPRPVGGPGPAMGVPPAPLPGPRAVVPAGGRP